MSSPHYAANSGAVEHVIDDPDVLEAIPVHADAVEAASPEFGSWVTFKLLGTEQAQQLLPQAPKRSAATIQVGPGFDDNNTLGYLLIGTRAQVQNGQGGVLASGYSFTYHAQQALWIQGDGSHHLTVTVLDERYR